MGDLYSINSWAASTSYVVNDIVTNGGFYYYATQNHTSTSNFSNDLNSNYWGGTITINGQIKPHFIWKLSYNYSLDIQPSVKSIRFGEGYSQEVNDGINNILLPINLNFEDRDLAEYTAILHFLHARNGSERFYFIAPSPYNVLKKFICPKWTPSQSFYGKYNIQCLFEERT